MKDEDFIERLFVASTHDTLLFFTSAGKVYWRKVWELPLASRGSRGRPLINLIPMEKEERVNAILSIREFDDDHFIFMATRNGVVKKTPLTQFSRPRVSGIIALDIKEGDQLVDVALTDGQQEVMLFSSGGKAVRFTEDNVRAMGRTAGGVRGIKLKDEQKVVGLVILSEEGTILTITENGYGKRTKVDEFRKTSRGTQGVTSIKTSERNGNVVGAAQVVDGDEIMMISNNGTLVRTEVEQISIISRNTQGVRLMRMIEGEVLVEVERIANLASDDSEDEETFELEVD
jgi:DNA gyrase subunit A